MMREGESEEVVNLFQEHYKIRLIHKNASSLFLEALEGVSDPEQKRKLIGKHFIACF